MTMLIVKAIQDGSVILVFFIVLWSIQILPGGNLHPYKAVIFINISGICEDIIEKANYTIL